MNKSGKLKVGRHGEIIREHTNSFSDCSQEKYFMSKLRDFPNPERNCIRTILKFLEDLVNSDSETWL